MQNMGIPLRMANAVHRLFGGLNMRRQRVIDALLADDFRLPLVDQYGVMTGPIAISVAAEQAARECYLVCDRVQTADAIQAGIADVCARRGVSEPVARTLGGYIARAVDKGWWRRRLRKELVRRFEHTSIQLGLTHLRADPYISREIAIAQAAQNNENQKLLELCIATNEYGDVYSLAKLATLGTANKAIRRGELMLRIRGFEEVASVLGHVGMFWTITCPSKFHSVGGTNDGYKDFTPSDAQKYLVGVWALIRSALHRRGIRPYGFRIAEPHTDGCPHWHMLLFLAPHEVEIMERVIRKYALQVDGDEDGAQKNRVKLVKIEAGKGTAAGYIAKYVSKNIDGTGVGDHKTFESGETYVITVDRFGDVELTASQRVTYWAQVWDIRQFQPIGGPQISVWRELSRLDEGALLHADDLIRDAYQATQKVESDDPAVVQRADFARFIWAMGGPQCGRDTEIRLASREVMVAGRYETEEVEKPVGVYLARQPQVVYESVRYQWTITGPGESAGSSFAGHSVGACPSPPWTRIAAASASTWTSVNKYTQSAEAKPAAQPKNKIVSSPFDAGRISDRNHVRCAEVDHIAVYLRHRKRAPGAPSVHLEYLREKYRDRHEVPVTSLRTPSVH